MHIRISIVVLFHLLIVACSVSEPRWIQHEKYVESRDSKKAFEIAKEFYLKSAEPKNDIDYEYKVFVVNDGYIVSIDTLYRQPDGNYAVAMDGDECVHLDFSFKVTGKKQCISPGPYYLSD